MMDKHNDSATGVVLLLLACWICLMFIMWRISRIDDFLRGVLP